MASRIRLHVDRPGRPADRAGQPGHQRPPRRCRLRGFFWRAAPGPASTFTATTTGEEEANGSTEPWLALVGGAYTLVFSGLGEGDHWFVRTGIYPGVCVALAFERTLPIPAGGRVARRHRVVVADGVLSREAAAHLAGLP